MDRRNIDRKGHNSSDQFDENPSQNDEGREEFPRISFDTVADWQRVKSNYQRAIMKQLDEQVDLNGLTDADKDALTVHLSRHIEVALKMAQPNLRVNGQQYDSLEGDDLDMEQFDEVLDRHIWALADKRLQYQKRLTEVRRTAPQQHEASLRKLLEDAHAVDAEEARMVDLIPEGNEDVDFEMADVWPRRNVMEHTIKKVVATTEELKQTMPKQEERSHRERLVAADVRALNHDTQNI